STNKEVREQLGQMARAEVCFNYLGQVADEEDLPFGRVSEPSGARRSLRGQNLHRHDIHAVISAGQLSLSWSYSQNIHQRETIEKLANEYIEQLRLLIAHCQSLEAGGYTPSDFPLAELTQEWLDTAALGGWKIEDIYGLSPLQQGLI